MAYGNKYYIYWCSKDVSGYVYIDEENYVGSASQLQMASDGPEINYNYSERIIGQNASVQLINTESDFFTLFPLLSSAEETYKMRIVRSQATPFVLFNGFIDTPSGSEQYWYKRPINLTASNQLNKLSEKILPSADLIEKKNLITLLQEALELTGHSFDIWVNCTLESSLGTYGNDDTLFNNIAIDNEVFQTGGEGRLNALQVITEILKPFDCTLFCWDDKWFISRYADIWDSTAFTGGQKEFHVYTNGQAYGYGDDAAVDNYPYDNSSTNIHDLTWVNNRSLISMANGYGKININLAENYYENLIIDDFKNITPTVGWPEQIDPSSRYWVRYINPGFFGDNDASNFLPAPGNLNGPDINQNVYGKSYGSIQNAIYRTGWQGDLTGFKNTRTEHVYIGTAFDITVEPQNTSLQLKWKHRLFSRKGKTGKYWNATDGTSDHTNERPPYFTLRWFLRLTSDPSAYFIKDQETGEYYRFQAERLYDTGKYYGTSAYNYKNIAGTELDDDNVFEMSETIDIGDASCGLWNLTSDSSDWKFVFGILPTMLWPSSDYAQPLRQAGSDINWGPGYVYNEGMGDVNFSVSSNKTPNKIIGEINVKTREELDINLLFYDLNSLNSKNGLYGGDVNYSTRTNLWSDDGTEYTELAPRLILDKFRIYQKPRQSISIEIKDTSIFHPLQTFGDSLQADKQFILGSYSYKPVSDFYKINLMEYDNLTTTLPNYSEVEKFKSYPVTLDNVSSPHTYTNLNAGLYSNGTWWQNFWKGGWGL